MPPQPYPRPATSLACLLVGLLFAIGLTAALAESVSVGDLRLDYGDAWQRAGSEEEAQADSVILRRADAIGPITMTVPKQPTRLRVPEARFYRQLETAWRAAAGEALRLDWLEAGGRRWRLARRPSVENADRAVFHLVSVADGQAQHLLVTVPGEVAELPQAVRVLLAGVPRAGENQITAADSAPDTHHGRRAAESVIPVWRLERTLYVLPDAAAFDALMRLERERLQADGGITGMGIAARAQGLTAFLAGFVQAPDRHGRVQRQGFDHAWEIAWEAPAAEVPSAATLMLRPSQLPAGLGLKVSLRLYCGPEAELSLVEKRLQQPVSGEPEVATRGCVLPTAGRTQAEIVGPAAASKPVVFTVDTVSSEAPTPQLMVLSVQPFRSGEGPGAALLGAGAVHYLYRPATPGR